MSRLIHELLLRLTYRATGFERLQRILASSPEMDADTFLRHSIEEFGVKARVHGAPSRQFTSCVFVCNHHTGAYDLLSIYPTLALAAPDLKVVANKELLRLKPFEDLLIGVNPISSGLRNKEASLEVIKHLRSGGNILIYPAGKVAGLNAGRVTDFPWRLGIADFVQSAAKEVVPIYVDAKNSRFFYEIRRFFPRLSLLFILRSLALREGRSSDVYFGQPIPSFAFMSMAPTEVVRRLRKAVYSLKTISSMCEETNGRLRPFTA